MLRREEGQITVFVALLFFVLMGVSLCVLEGMYSFSESALAESAIKGAGNYVLANYNRSLFDRYHLFFLDPRESRMERLICLQVLETTAFFSLPAAGWK